MRQGTILAAFVAAAACMAGSAIAEAAEARGELLYNTYCVGCHTAQVHWRERRQARDWPTLKVEVTRWQKAAGQNLDVADIDALVAYLNGRYYHFPEGDRRGSGDGEAPSIVALRAPPAASH
jgi:mono/diheme cytochrome c family protein